MRFRATQHLRRQREIRGVREQGRRIDCRAFTLWWKRRAADDSKGDAGSGPRVCVIASSAAVGHAVRRNRAKRRLREVFREGQRLVPPGCDLLLIARAAATDAPLPDLQAKFAAACRQIEADGAEVRA